MNSGGAPSATRAGSRRGADGLGGVARCGDSDGARGALTTVGCGDGCRRLLRRRRVARCGFARLRVRRCGRTLRCAAVFCRGSRARGWWCAGAGGTSRTGASPRSCAHAATRAITAASSAAQVRIGVARSRRYAAAGRSTLPTGPHADAPSKTPWEPCAAGNEMVFSKMLQRGAVAACAPAPAEVGVAAIAPERGGAPAWPPNVRRRRARATSGLADAGRTAADAVQPLPQHALPRRRPMLGTAARGGGDRTRRQRPWRSTLERTSWLRSRDVCGR